MTSLSLCQKSSILSWVMAQQFSEENSMVTTKFICVKVWDYFDKMFSQCEALDEDNLEQKGLSS